MKLTESKLREMVRGALREAVTGNYASADDIYDVEEAVRNLIQNTADGIFVSGTMSGVEAFKVAIEELKTVVANVVAEFE